MEDFEYLDESHIFVDGIVATPTVLLSFTLDHSEVIFFTGLTISVSPILYVVVLLLWPKNGLDILWRWKLTAIHVTIKGQS